MTDQNKYGNCGANDQIEASMKVDGCNGWGFYCFTKTVGTTSAWDHASNSHLKPCKKTEEIANAAHEDIYDYYYGYQDENEMYDYLVMEEAKNKKQMHNLRVEQARDKKKLDRVTRKVERLIRYFDF